MNRLLWWALWTASAAMSQTYERIADPFSVVDGQPIPNAFSGGTYIPKADLIDIDADGDVDVFVTQVDGRLTLFRNAGTGSSPDFQWETDSFENLFVGQWSRFADLDDDGDYDLLVNRPGSRVGYFANIGSASSPMFSWVTDELLDAFGAPILSEDPSVPFLADIDGDGDLDFFTGRSLGTVALYTNSGSPASHEFTFTTDVFEDIVIVTPGLRRLHGASSIAFEDIDNDLDLDLFWGDFFSSGLYYLENLGTPFDPDIPDTTTSTYPRRELLTSGFNAPLFSDLDGDMDSDLLIGVLYRDVDLDNFWYYRNDGSRDSAHFLLATKNFIHQIDVGRQSRPITVDIDADGDEDLFMGSYDGRLLFYRNTGTSSSAVFVRDTTLTIPVNADEFIAAPAFADLDGDGDFDIVIGFFTGRMAFFENTGTPAAPTFSLVTSHLGTIDVGNNAAPCFGDLDNDGDLDLMTGRSDGLLRVYRNIGSATSLMLHPDSILVTMGGTSIGQESVPQCFDRDGDGDLDIVAGNKEGILVLLENTGTAAFPKFGPALPAFDGVRTTLNAAPWFTDADGDGDLDLFLGNIKGGLEYYRANMESPSFGTLTDQIVVADSTWTLHVPLFGSPVPVVNLLDVPFGMVWDSLTHQLTWRPTADADGIHPVTLVAINEAGSDTAQFRIRVIVRMRLAQNAPNPFNGSTTIEFDLAQAGQADLTVYNILGQRVRRLIDGATPAGMHRVVWDGLNEEGNPVASGVYVYRLKTGAGTRVKKMMVVR